MKNKSLYELGKLAQKGNEIAMLEIIERKKKTIKKYSFGDEDRYQFIILKLIEGIKNYKF
ncbi:MAG: helix-turn-helix domain-containing protein [Clostridia bacterium]|nr:helix-turn-helix domain-containing protein [Clostridia bacterium]